MTLPSQLAGVVEEFTAVPAEMRVEVLLEYAGKVPPLPEGLAEDGAMERVDECQTPFFLAARIDEDGRVRLHFDCPTEAPTQRAFAGVLTEGLDGARPEEVLAVPSDLPSRLGLGEAISMLRLRGFQAILARLRRQVELAGTDAGQGLGAR